jgi:hypothetical protein
MTCSLERLAKKQGWPKCSGELHYHHIINRTKTRGNTKARKYCDQPKLRAWVCAAHNVGRYADTREAVSELLTAKTFFHGEDEMRRVVDEIPWKKPQEDLRYSKLLGE